MTNISINEAFRKLFELPKISSETQFWEQGSEKEAEDRW